MTWKAGGLKIMNFKIGFELLKDTVQEWQEDKAARLAAALAYYTVFSLAPLVIIVLGVIGFFFGQDIVGSYLIEQVQGMVGKEGADVIRSIIENASQPTTSLLATAIGIGTLLFGATGLFGQLQDALNTVWGVAPKPGRSIKGFIETRFLSLTMVLGIGFLLLVSLVLSTVLSTLNNFLSSLWTDSLIVFEVINFVLSFGVITLLFAMIYKILPDVKIHWRDVWMGAAVTAFLFSIGKFLLGYYLGNQSFGSTYGAAGSILIILLWVYYSAQILLFGAEFTQVYAKRFGSKIEPDKYAVPLTGEMRARQGIPKSEAINAAVRLQEPHQSAISAGLKTSPAKDSFVPKMTYKRRGEILKKPGGLISILVSFFLMGLFIRRVTRSRG